MAQESGLPATLRGPPAEPAPAPKPLRAAAPPPPCHPTDRPGRFPGAVRVASTVREASQVLRGPAALQVAALQAVCL